MNRPLAILPLILAACGAGLSPSKDKVGQFTQAVTSCAAGPSCGWRNRRNPSAGASRCRCAL